MWTIIIDVLRVLAEAARQGPYNDCAALGSLVTSALGVAPKGLALTDADFDGERKHRHIRDVIGAGSVIHDKRGRADWEIKGTEAQALPAQTIQSAHRGRESVLSAVKRKLSAKAPGHST